MIERQETKQRMSRIVKHNGTIYLCGQVCADATKDITEQTQTMLDKVEALLEQAGSDKEHMLSATIYLKDMKDFQEMNPCIPYCVHFLEVFHVFQVNRC